MGTLEEALKELNLKGFADIVNSMDKSDPSFSVELLKIVESYVDKIIAVCKNSSVEVVIGILDFFYHNFSNFIVPVLRSNDEKIIRAQLVIEKINGHEVRSIKNDIQLLKDIEAYKTIMGSTDSTSMKRKDITENVLNILHSFIKDKDLAEWEEIVNNDLIKFAKNINKVEKNMFNGDSHLFYNKYDFINSIFLMEDIDSQLLSDIYNNVLTKNKAFLAFDYVEIFNAKAYLIAEVKGLFKKFPISLLESDLITKDDFEDYDALFREMCELNKDDENGLRWFFLELSKSIGTNIDFVMYLNEQDYYQKYTSKSFDDMYNEIMMKMENRELDVDDNWLIGLGASDKFINNFQKYFDLLMTGEDEFVKKYSLPVIVALIEKQKKYHGLDFEVTFTRDHLDNDMFGNYNREENKMYINPNALMNNDNPRVSFANAVDTVYHETRHAVQRREILTSNKFSFDNLIMAIDWCVAELGGTSYYHTNYTEISYEIDAREIAYVETMKLFKQYPKVQDEYKKNYVEVANPLNKYMRKNVFFSLESYFGIIENFLELVDGLLADGLNKDKDYYDYIFGKLDKYPVFKEFFDFGREKKGIRPKSKEYFNQKKKEADEKKDELEKREYYYSILAFRYAKKIGEYLKDRVVDISEIEGPYNEALVEEAISHVGKPPIR